MSKGRSDEEKKRDILGGRGRSRCWQRKTLSRPSKEDVAVAVGGRHRQGRRLLSSFVDGRNSIAM